MGGGWDMNVEREGERVSGGFCFFTIITLFYFVFWEFRTIYLLSLLCLSVCLSLSTVNQLSITPIAAQ